jgi:coenzyme F420-reducing hydrogenase alpha subunit
MKITKAQLKQIIKEELEAVLENDGRMMAKIREATKHIGGSKKEEFVKAAHTIAKMFEDMDENVSAGSAFSDMEDDEDKKRKDYENWHDHLSEIENSPDYKSAVASIVGMKFTTKTGTYPAVSVRMEKHGGEARTEAEVRFSQGGKLTRDTPSSITISELGVESDRALAQIKEIN